MTSEDLMDDVAGRVFDLDVPSLQFPAVYGKRQAPHGEQRHEVVVQAELIPEEVRATLYLDGRRPTVCAKSRIAPLVTEKNGRYDAMTALFAMADVRNVPRDRLLRDIPVRLRLQVCKTETPRGVFNLLILKGVTVDVEDLQNAMGAIDE